MFLHNMHKFYRFCNINCIQKIKLKLDLQDLHNKSANADEYNLLRAAGLIRQLLIDDTLLVDSVNQRHHINIISNVQKRNHKYQKKVDNPI